MGKVQLVIRPWLSSTLRSATPGPLLLEEEITGDTTIGRLLKGLASGNKAFAEAVFDSQGENLSGRVSVLLNGRLLGFQADLSRRIKDGDCITLLPTIEGG
ncbi:MAG: MoaD/ThiS family protein [Dehalococcoidales bacterium]|nr:MoaD/ThiS family protein [Dehalococcoidales bacterium]